MVVFALARDDDRDAGLRVGVTASRKVGGAVARARSKRRLRELFRTDPARQTSHPADLVINARRGCAAAPWDDLQREYRRCVRSLERRLANA
jgi:ribonuclease P protein component